MSSENLTGQERLRDFRKQIHRSLATRKAQPEIVGEGGSHPVIVVDEHELVSSVLAIARRTGGYANLYIVMDDDEVRSAALLPSTSALNADSAEAFQFHRDSEIGLLLNLGTAANTHISLELPSLTGALRPTQSLQPA